MKIHRVQNASSLLDIASVQERTAAMVAEVLPDAERAGRTASAMAMFRLLHRCRLQAEVLRAHAEAARSARG